MANVYDPETEGEQRYQSPDLGPGHDRPAGDSSDPRTIHSDPRGDLRKAEPGGGSGSSSSGSFNFNPGGDRGGTTGSKGGSANLGSSSDKGFFNSGALSTAETAAAAGGLTSGVQTFAKGTKNFFWGSKKRKRSTVTTSLVAATVGGIIIGGSLLSGPFEFVHIAQLLEQFHFSTQQDESDSRVTKLVRYAHYSRGDNTYKTNLGYVGNKLADKFETRLNEQGLESAYTKHFGLKNGYIIDEGNENFKGKTQDEIKTELREKYNNPSLEFTTITDDAGHERLFLKQPSGYRASLGMTRETLKEAGYGKISSAISARIMGTRDGVTWHPLQKLDNKIYAKLEDKIAQWNKEKAQNISEGEPANPTGKADPKDNPGETQAQKDQAAADAGSTAAEGNAVAQEGDSVAQDARSGGDTNNSKLSGFTDSVSVKIAGGGVAAAGVLCMARGIAENVGNVKQKQTAQPLIRTGVRALSEGNQVMSSQDIDINQLSNDSKQLVDKKTDKSWYDAESIQSEVGNPGHGVPPDNTLNTLGSGSPLDFLVSGTPIADVLSPVCSTAGIAIQTVVGFLGGPVSALAGFAATSVLGPPVVDAISQYLAGQAVKLNPSGPEFGNYVNFGSFLAANDQGISSGGRALTSDETTQLADITNADYQHQFDQHNLAYRLFNPNDRMSLVSSIMDRQSNSVTANASNMALAMPNIGRSIATTFSNIFSGVGHAAGQPYNYGGMPEIAFSNDEMSNPSTENPYANGDAAADILSSSAGADYISRAKECFGDTIQQTSVPGPSGGSNQVWDVTFGTDPVNIYSADYKGIRDSCNDAHDSNWLKVRFFIFDTQNIKAANCYEGDDQSCTDMGFGSDASTGSAETSGPQTVDVSGDAQQLAQQILQAAKDGKIIFSVPNPANNNDDSTAEDNLKDTANGQPAHTSTSCLGGGILAPNRTTTLDPKLLKFILLLSQQEHFTIDELAGGCHYESNSNHYNGTAVDFGCPFDPGPADSIGQQFGISDGTGETCSTALHYHYSIGGN